MDTLIKHLKMIQTYLFRGYANNEKGIALTLVILAIGGLALIGAAAIGVATGEIGIAHNDQMYKTALNLAEAGVTDAGDGLEGDRDLLPKPLGTVNSTSYSFNTALNSGGRYHVTVSIPNITTLTEVALAGASSVVVANAGQFGAGDVVALGNNSIHLITRIGNVSGSALIFQDTRGNPYYLPTDLAAGDYVAKNVVRVVSTGQAGSGLTGTYTLGGWRNITALNGAPNQTLPSGGEIRSTAAIQAEYTIQDINMFEELSAEVTPSGNKFTAPLLVTESLEVSPYSKGDYSGPIFRTANTNVSFQNPEGTNIPDSANPKVITIPSRIDVSTVVSTAASNATCYQKGCNVTGANQQIYYLNGYDIQVKSYHPNGAGTPNFPFYLGDNYYYDATYIYFDIILHNDIYINSTDNLTVNLNMNENPTAAQMSSAGNVSGGVALLGVVPANGNISMNGSNLVFKNKETYTAGTTIHMRVLLSQLPAGGTYLRMYDNSSNVPGFGGSEAWTNGIWVTALGDIMSEERQGNTTLYTDGGIGSHSNHSSVITIEPVKQARGSYYTGSSVLSSATWVTANGAVLFGGKRLSDGQLPNGTSSPWLIGDSAVYYTTYYIHTSAAGSCNDHDISVVAKTIVTYLGTSALCGNTQRLFMYETIWNHNSNNTYNFGVQNNDAEATSQNISRKGFYRLIKGESTGSTAPLTVDSFIGDEEFNSALNHSAKTDFHSATVNVNISRIRMVGWANPPMVFDSGSGMMIASQSEFPDTTAWLPGSTTSSDLQSLTSRYSSFKMSGDTRGLDLSSLTLRLGTIPATRITATISGPNFTRFEIKNGAANLFFDTANGIAFNIKEINIETRGDSSNITIGTAANPVTMFADRIELETENCGNPANFTYAGRIISREAEFERNLNYNIYTPVAPGGNCLDHTTQSFIFLRKSGWKELRN